MMRTMPQGDPRAAHHYQTVHDPDASGEELEASVAWIDASEAQRAAFDQVSSFMSACDNVAGALPGEEVRAALGRHEWRPNRWRTNWRIAAGFMMAVGVAALVHVSTVRNPPTLVARYATGIGEVRSVSLADRSTVVLAGASSVSVAYGHDVRHISLIRGEALFKVAHDANKPFIVETGNGSVRALGTEFDVHSSSIGTRVTVVEGKVSVAVRSPNRAAVAKLRQGMQVAYSNTGQMSPVTLVDATRATSWRTGTLRFVSQPLVAVVADLNRYSVRPIILMADELSYEEITGSVRTDAIFEWLYALAESAGMTIQISKQGAIILSAPGKQPMEAELVRPHPHTDDRQTRTSMR